MSLLTAPFLIKQGTRAAAVVHVRDVCGARVNLTEGFSARMQLRTHADSGHTIDELTSDNGRINLRADGRVEMIWPTSVTESFDCEPRMIGDLEIVDAIGEVIQSYRLHFEVEREVTWL